MQIIKEIGAYAGLAAVVGLAVLSALYFSQARDVKRLREWAGRAPERATEQAAQQAAAPAGRVVAQPKPGTTPAGPAPAPAAAAGATPAAAGAKPAAATPAGQKQATPGEQAKPAAQPTPAPATAAQPGADKPGLQPAGAQAKVGQAAPGAKEAAAGAGAGAGAATSPPSDAQAAKPAQPAQATPSRPDGQTAAARSGSPPPPVPSGVGGRPRLPSRPGAPARPAPSQTAILAAAQRDPWHRRLLANPRYLTVAIAGILIVGGGAAYGVTQLGKSEGPTSADKSEGRFAPSSGGKKGSRRAPINPSTVTVSVLNGTTVPGLAAQIGDSIDASGFQLGNVTNSSDQQRAESVVLFRPGHEREAAAVGRKLRIGQREPIDAQNQALAGDATVVVIVGADKTP
jgi:hypothetical protein